MTVMTAKFPLRRPIGPDTAQELYDAIVLMDEAGLLVLSHKHNARQREALFALCRAIRRAEACEEEREDDCERDMWPNLPTWLP